MSAVPVVSTASSSEEELGAAGPVSHTRWRGCAAAAAALLLLGYVSTRQLLPGLRGSETETVMLAWKPENVMKADHKGYTMLSFGRGTACRKSLEDDTLVPKTSEGKVTMNMRWLDCRQSCIDNKHCHGYEFRYSQHRCEIWDVRVGAHAQVFQNRTVGGPPDFECVVKNPTCHELTSHKAVLESAVKDLIQYAREYCAEGPSETDYSKCSRAYARSLLGVDRDTCMAKNEACDESKYCDAAQLSS